MDAKLFIDLLPEYEDFLMDIHTAASIGCDERVRDIIENSESKDILDGQNKKGWTPLMYAACCANLKVSLLLLEEGAETDIKNYEGHTALILASKCGSGDVVNLLIDSGATVNAKDLRGWTALFYATAFGHTSVVQLLIERGAAVNIMDENEGITPLMLAAIAGHKKIVHDFLQLGANVQVQCRSGDTARSLALKYGHVNIKNLIDAYFQSKKKSNGPNVQSSDLASLLKDLQLTKYYPIFERHGIDLNTFWLLTDDNLKELGIQLMGPRKKICREISHYNEENSQKSNSKDTANLDNIVMENKKLREFIEKLKVITAHEKKSREAAEHNLADAIQSLKNCKELFNATVSEVISVFDKLGEHQEYMKSLLSTIFQEMDFLNNHETRSICNSLDYMQKIVETGHQNLVALQQKKLHK